MYTTSFTYHILVPIVYWGLLSGSWDNGQATVTKRWMNYSQHGLDFVAMFIEFSLNRVVFAWGHLVFAYIPLVVYIFFTWIFQPAFPNDGPQKEYVLQ
jgi:hypothetical protein